MTRRNPPAQWVLPDIVNPSGRRCFFISVPDDPLHIAAFRGALLALASGYNWADDPLHKAREVALVWREVIDNMIDDSCLNFRTNPFDNCGAQWTQDGGEVWVEFFNARACATDTVNDALGNQAPPGGANPGPGQCFDFDFVIQGSETKIIPIALASGWTLQITQLGGAWYDGTTFGSWDCPDGNQFSLGACIPGTSTLDPADPIPSSAHMRLILALPNGTYASIPLDGSNYTVPPGLPAGNYFLRANDSALGDNQGSISLHMVACNVPLTCYEYNFSSNDGGFARGGYLTFGPDLSGRIIGQYSGGAWVTEDLNTSGTYWDRAVSIHRLWTGNRRTFKIELEYDYTPGGVPFGVSLFRSNGTVLSSTTISGVSQILTWEGDLSLDGIGAQVWPFGAYALPDGAGAIHKLRIFTTDAAPDGSVPCP